MQTTPNTITVITPVYNMAKYLDLCISSILRQSYTDFVLLLIDDGSTDGSAQICDRYASADERIKVVHTQNQGQGDARNTALRFVETDFIAMIDSDDCVNVRFLEILMKTMKETGADMVEPGFLNFLEDREINIEEEIAPSRTEVLTRGEAIERLCLAYSPALVMPQKLYRSSLFKGISYPQIGVNIDEWVIHHLFLNMDRLAIVDCAAYYYRQSAEGMTRNFSLKKISGVNAVADRLSALEKTEYACYKNALYERLFVMAKRFYRNLKLYDLDGRDLLKPLQPVLRRAFWDYLRYRKDLLCRREMLAQWLFCHNFTLYEAYCRLLKLDDRSI